MNLRSVTHKLPASETLRFWRSAELRGGQIRRSGGEHVTDRGSHGLH
jgi:hypothetical protein